MAIIAIAMPARSNTTPPRCARVARRPVLLDQPTTVMINVPANKSPKLNQITSVPLPFRSPNWYRSFRPNCQKKLP